MAKLTKFTISPSGQLVYKSTGKLAPESYVYRKNTVYRTYRDENGELKRGRRVGSLSRKLTKTEAAKIAKAEKNRQARARRAKGKQARPSQRKPSRPSKKAPATQRYGEDWEQFEDTEFPESAQLIKEDFARRVREAALSVAPDWLKNRIRAFTTEALWQAYTEDQYIFELYFKYHSAVDTPHKSDVSVWLYQFVTRIEQYMNVKV